MAKPSQYRILAASGSSRRIVEGGYPEASANGYEDDMSETSPGQLIRDWAAVIFALVLPTVVTLAYFVLADGYSATTQQVTYGVAKTLQFLFPIAYVVLIQREWPRLKPVTSNGIGKGLAFGLVISGAMLALFHFALKDAPFFDEAEVEMRDKISDMDLGSPTAFVGMGVFYSLFHSFLEEYYWRWFVFGQLARLTTLIPAIVVSSLGFMAHHILVIGTYFGFLSPVTWIFSLCVAIGGAYWAWLYHRSGSLLGPWLSHLLVDAAIFTAGYEVAGPLMGE
jgi:membrane protease YdiL (CAAX protease family)